MRLTKIKRYSHKLCQSYSHKSNGVIQSVSNGISVTVQQLLCPGICSYPKLFNDVLSTPRHLCQCACRKISLKKNHVGEMPKWLQSQTKRFQNITASQSVIVFIFASD